MPRWIGTGWKMNFLLREAEAYLDALAAGLGAARPEGLEVFVVPPFTVLRDVCAGVKARRLPLHVGAQNMHWEASGAFTGEVSPPMVKDCGAELVELGHSERRALFGETDAAVNRKVRAALAAGLRPLVCVGDTGEEKALGAARETVVRQVRMALHGIPVGQLGQVILAYEPVWAIGAGGTPAAPGEVAPVHAAVRGALAELHGAEAARQVPILYGGSVNLENARALLEVPEVDGLFVGRTAWRPQGLLELVRLAGEVGRRAEAPPGGSADGKGGVVRR